jgi:hypothetical protein
MYFSDIGCLYNFSLSLCFIGVTVTIGCSLSLLGFSAVGCETFPKRRRALKLSVTPDSTPSRMTLLQACSAAYC